MVVLNHNTWEYSGQRHSNKTVLANREKVCGMASRLTALPLSSGESFILETDHGGKRCVILVDGGQSKSNSPKKNGLYKAIR
jgi:hypothetical protein